MIITTEEFNEEAFCLYPGSNQTEQQFVINSVNDSVRYRFVADVHLGRLAKWLRVLGFDTFYSHYATAVQLAEIATTQNRFLLSKSNAFSQQPNLLHLVITSSNSLEQLQQVIEHFYLKDKIQPFTHCLVCNGHLHPIPKAAIEETLLPNTKAAFDKFWQCDACKRIYWEGSHYERMQQLVKQVQMFRG